MSNQGYKSWGNSNQKDRRQAPRPQQASATPPAPLQNGPGGLPASFPNPSMETRPVFIDMVTGTVREGLTASHWASNEVKDIPRVPMPAFHNGARAGASQTHNTKAKSGNLPQRFGLTLRNVYSAQCMANLDIADSTPGPHHLNGFGFNNNRPIVSPIDPHQQQASSFAPPPSDEKEKRFVEIAADHAASRISRSAPEQIGDSISISLDPNRKPFSMNPEQPVETDINPKTNKVYTPEEWAKHLRKRDARKVERKAKSNYKARKMTAEAQQIVQSEDMSDQGRIEFLVSSLEVKDRSIAQLRQVARDLTIERNKFERDLEKSSSDLIQCQEDLKNALGFKELLEQSEARCAVLEERNEKLEKSLADNAKAIQLLIEKQDEIEDKLRARDEDLLKADGQIEELELKQAKEVANLRKQIAEGTQVADGLKQDLDVCSDNAENAKSRIQDLESELSEQSGRTTAIEAAFDKLRQDLINNVGAVKSAADSTANSGTTFCSGAHIHPSSDHHDAIKIKCQQDDTVEGDSAEKDTPRDSYEASSSESESVDETFLIDVDDEMIRADGSSDLDSKSRISSSHENEAITSPSIKISPTSAIIPCGPAKKGGPSRKVIGASFFGTIMLTLAYFGLAFYNAPTPEVIMEPEFEFFNQQLVLTPTTCPFQAPSTSALAPIPTKTVATYNTAIPEDFWVSFQQVIEIPHNGSFVEEDVSKASVVDDMCELREEFPKLRKAIFTAGLAVVIHAAFSRLSYC
ncbi:hypothetical protein BKA65DRAFT_477281 [Rhexocercosporidium sp. MPI-PUGE-AT-0058]|nr:hypothetical protein BKA65DRAFT_477281 [Rhexocercosporidium sp. MPI-PUGE-AT-0058]